MTPLHTPTIHTLIEAFAGAFKDTLPGAITVDTTIENVRPSRRSPEIRVVTTAAVTLHAAFERHIAVHAFTGSRNPVEVLRAELVDDYFKPIGERLERGAGDAFDVWANVVRL